MSSASTGGTEGSSPASSPASATSLTMAAPKYGTLVPNRVFVGGISASTSEAELAQVFSAYGNVKATKIISDRAGVSKGYGFVTFETEEEAKRLQQESECIVLRERKLNIAPAIKKQPFSRSFDGSSGSPPSVPTNTYYYTNGMGLAYQNGMTFYNTAAPAPATSIAPPTDPGTIYQTTGVFGPQTATGHQTFAPVMYPCPAPSLYMPQQYQYSMPYEPYYTGAAATGAQYLYTSSSQNNTNGGGNNSSSGNNGTGGTSPPTGPPPPLPSLPPATHFYASTAPPPHHHPSVATGPPPPAQVDHLYYSFTAGPPPPPPPHAPMGLTEQQLLLYTADASCQQTASDNQNSSQEDSRSTPNHSEQPHGETQASNSSTPLVPLMPVKFPVSGRYTNYQPITIHSANLHSTQGCSNDTDDCTANPMHCRTIIYHPTTVYIPHTHPPPPYHNPSNSTSLLPTPFSPSHQFDSNTKAHNYNSRNSNKYMGTNAQNNYAKGQNHSFPLIHQNMFIKSQNAGSSQSHIKCSTANGSHKYQVTMSSRLPVQYNKRNAGSNMGSPACFLSQKSGNYGSGQGSHKVNVTSNYGLQKSMNYLNSGAHSLEHANGRKNHNDDQYFEIGSNNKSSISYGSSRKCLPNNNYKHSRLETHGNDNNRSSENYDTQTDNVTTLSSHPLSSTVNTDTSNSQSKPTSPPPAPYSPMTQPLPTLSPPNVQVQFYAPVQNRYQQPPMPSSQQHQQQQQQQQTTNSQRTRYSVGQALSANRKSSDKYSNSGSQTTMLRQSKYKVNGITTSKISDDNLGGAGDAPTTVGRLPITPPGTPRTHAGHPAGDQAQLSDTCHQMQALAL